MNQQGPASPDAVERVLGLAIDHRRERDLLALPEGPASTEQVLLALKLQLARVASHPESLSPAGAEVRMMLHAAAARLLLAQEEAPAARVADGGAPSTSSTEASFDSESLEPVARGQVSLEQPDTIDLAPIAPEPRLVSAEYAPHDAPDDAPLASTHDRFAVASAPPRPSSLVDAHALSILARHGGCSPLAMQELCAVAASRGISPDDMQEWMLGVVRGDSIDASARALGPSATLSRLPARSRSGVVPGRRPSARPGSPVRPASQGADPAISQLAAMEAGAVGPVAGLDATVDEVPAYEQSEDPLRRLLIRTGLGVGIGVVTVATLALGLRLMSSRTTPAPAPTPGDVGTSAGAATAPRELFPAPVARDDRADPSPTPTRAPVPAARDMPALIASLRGAAQELDRNPVASRDAFELAMREVPAIWPSSTPDRFLAALDAATEYVYRAGARAETSEAALGAITGSLEAWRRRPLDADAVARSVWAGALAGRLVDEPDLGWSFRARLRDALVASAGPVSLPSRATGQDAAAAMLERIAKEMLPRPGADATQAALTPAVRVTPEAWDAWVACVASSIDAPAARTGVQLQVLDASLRAGVDPTRDASVASAIRAIARSLPWDRASPARRRLVAWFGAADADTISLHALTSVVVAQKDSEADVSLVLSATATEADRRELRDRYASIWSLSDALADGESVTRVVQAIDAALLERSQGSAPVERLARAARLAGLVTAAEMTWDNRRDAASDALAQVASMRPPGAAPAPGLVDDSIANTWGDRYLAAGADLLRKRDAIRQASGVPSRLEARIIVEEAMRGPSAEIRREATKLLDQHASLVVLQLALLDFAPFIPATRENSAIIERVTLRPLPSVRSPMWRVASRRAIVESLSQRLSPTLGQGVDTLAADLAHWYEQRLSQGNARALSAPTATTATTATIPTTAAALPASSSPAASVQRYRAALATLAQRGWSLSTSVPSVASILARLQQRLDVASGDPQRLAAEQAAIVELLARMIVIERPGAGADVAAILQQWQQEASRAQHVFEQLESGEAAQARLWLVRLKGQSP